jgi:hypothetical protein
VRKVCTGFKRGEGLVVVLWALHYVVLFLLILNLTDWSLNPAEWGLFFSKRHALSLLLVSVCWIGEGFWTSYQWVLMKGDSYFRGHHLNSQRKSVIVWGVWVAITLAIILPKTLKPQRYDRLPEKWAGIWIKNQSGTGTTIFTTMPRVAYYADGVWEAVDPAKDGLEHVLVAMVKKNAAYLVIEGNEAIRFPEVAEPTRRDLLEVMRYERKEMEKIIIYTRAPQIF